MEPLVLTDNSVTPTDELVFSIIGKNRIHWQKLMNGIAEQFPDAKGEWNYYNDGKNWLFKMIRKKKTLFWIGVLSHTFRVTFYFGDKAEPLINESNLTAELKEEFRNGKHYGKIRGLSVKISKAQDVNNAFILAGIKSKV
ncbi:MAG: DUF3788 family protein [Bacteroidales bacterium]